MSGAPASFPSGIPTGVHVLLEHGGKVLLMRRAGTGFFDGQYSLPGGHVEPAESLLATARREVFEELGICVGGLEYVGVAHRMSDTNRIDFFFRACDWSGAPTIREPHKCDDLLWAGCDALPENTVEYVRRALALLGDGPTGWLLETGWERC